MMFFKSATQPKVTVQATITINIDMKEVSEYVASRISAIMKSNQYTSIEDVITINQDSYLQSTNKRLLLVDSISTEMYKRLRSINTVHSRTANYSTENILTEMKNTVKPFIEQLHYDKIHSNKTDASTNGESQWLARLLMQNSTMGYTPFNVPVTGILINIRYLLNCKYKLLGCARYVIQ